MWRFTSIQTHASRILDWTGGPGCHSVFKIIPVVFRTGLCARQSSSSMKSFQFEFLFLPAVLEENTYTPLYLK